MSEKDTFNSTHSNFIHWHFSQFPRKKFKYVFMPRVPWSIVFQIPHFLYLHMYANNNKNSCYRIHMNTFFFMWENTWFCAIYWILWSGLWCDSSLCSFVCAADHVFVISHWKLLGATVSMATKVNTWRFAFSKLMLKGSAHA